MRIGLKQTRISMRTTPFYPLVIQHQPNYRSRRYKTMTMYANCFILYPLPPATVDKDASHKQEICIHPGHIPKFPEQCRRWCVKLTEGSERETRTKTSFTSVRPTPAITISRPIAQQPQQPVGEDSARTRAACRQFYTHLPRLWDG